MSKVGLYLKMLVAGGIMCVGGPALVYYVTPTDEALFKQYNPELQKRSLANRQARQEDFTTFVDKLKEHSRSDKPIWVVAKEEEARTKAYAAEENQRQNIEAQHRREEIKRQALGGG